MAPSTQSATGLAEQYHRVRQASELLCEPLQVEDYIVQSMPDVSPTKWHLAHTTWFFETFIVSEFCSGYRSPDPRYAVLFNSYYNSVGPQHDRPRRGVLSRPTVGEVMEYRTHVDRWMEDLLSEAGEEELNGPLGHLLQVGLHHEQQHQELMLMDIKHVFWANPLRPAYLESPPAAGANARRRRDASLPAMRWRSYEGGVRWIGHKGDQFAYDNEEPRHREYVEPFELATRPVTCGEYLQFIEDGGYRRPMLWLSDGWVAAQENRWQAPLYWEQVDGRWQVMTLSGMRDLAPEEPVCHVSYYEADAFARWAGCLLPSEAAWESAASDADPAGNFVECGRLHPAVAGGRDPAALLQMFGDVWEWTASPYTCYPGYMPPQGAMGEYNSKFASGQMVLRGGSCVTPAAHIRPTYRNFFAPSCRWPFTGIRLVRQAANMDSAAPVKPRPVTCTPHLEGELMPSGDPEVSYVDHEPTRDDLRDDVLQGLAKPQKAIPSKYFYDQRGSALFEKICEQPEYYITRTELAIMSQHVVAMSDRIGPRAMLIEYGSGEGVKTQILLDHLRAPAAFVLIDISAEHLKGVAAELLARYPDVEVLPVAADFTSDFAIPDPPGTVERRVAYFPGSTIGNFSHGRACELMESMRERVGTGGGLLIGIDLKKNAQALIAAYSDSAGVTREFNMNLLKRMNRELDADFDLSQFEHRAVWNQEQGRMESHLVSKRRQSVTIDDQKFCFDPGETIHTEVSYKYDLEQFAAMAREAGFRVQDVWLDEEQLFSIQYLTAE